MMDQGASKITRVRELPPLPQRGQRAPPTMSSLDTAAEGSIPRQKKKKLKKERTNGVDDVDAEPGVELGGLGSRRESEVGGHVTPDPTTEAPPLRRKKKKKNPTADLEDHQADLVNGDAADQTTDGEEPARKPRKKKRPKVVESQLPDELDVEEDDIVAEASSPIPQHALFSAPQCQSQPVGKVFVERNKRFQAAERSDWRKSSDQTDAMTDFQQIQPLWTTRDVSVQVHEGFRGFGLYCHGFLAGLAVWNIVVVYLLAGQHLTAPSNLLRQYHGLAYPCQALLYLLLAVSTVAAFDRVNLAKGSEALREFVTLDPVALASFLYFSALVLSLSQQMTSDRIHLYPSSNATLWPPGSEHQILHPWVTVNLVVALLVGLAWIFIASQPGTDYTQGYLVAMEIDPPKPEDKSEMTA
ncbi:transmembrane protein 237A-like isoform X2 [Salarias fasciatus]|uniref:Transmembrane protein 237A-like n=1 Tax=Salarias fasciatus TaxID=181472 RepID=A0A672HUS6_SALFA|nr:transmembrane protein 237A-like isoform X2 [Salarias fasciatus]